MNNLIRWLSSLGKCALVGIFVGALAGFIVEMLLLGGPVAPPQSVDLVRIIVITGLFCWVAVLLFFGAIARYGVMAIALPSFVTTIITTAATILVNYQLRVPALAVFIGILIGLLVGKALCRACARLAHAQKENNG